VKWTTNIIDGKDLLSKKITRGSTLTFISSNINETNTKVAGEGNSATGRRKSPQNHGLTEPGLQAKDVSALEISSTKEVSSLAQPLHPLISYWTSLEAKYLFKPIEEETTLKAINNQIMILEKASESENGYFEAVAYVTTINWEDIPTYQVFQIRQSCLYLALALNLAKERMNGWTWKMCCEREINMHSFCGMKATSYALTIMEWY